MKFTERPLAITDIETTGLEPREHEIVDIGLVLVNQESLEILDTLDLRVKPEHPETGEELGIKISGYNKDDWEDAVDLKVAMQQYALRTKDAMFAAHNVTMDWGFIEEAFYKTRVENLMDYHRIDLFTFAYEKLRDSGLVKFNMSELAKNFSLEEEPMPHRGINGAMQEYQIYKKLRELN